MTINSCNSNTAIECQRIAASHSEISSQARKLEVHMQFQQTEFLTLPSGTTERTKALQTCDVTKLLVADD